MTCCANAGPAIAGRIKIATAPSKIAGLVIAASLVCCPRL